MEVRVYESIRSIGREAWDALRTDFPFAEYHFLAALETTGCLGRRTGWFPAYLVAREDDRVLGALIGYFRTNSWGEYIFDFAWAQGAEAAGLEYYPKWTSAVPFTPATGSKFVLAPGLDVETEELVRAALLERLGAIAAAAGAGSLHALFIPPGEREVWRRAGFDVRHSYQFHWFNRGYATFEDFLGALTSKRRREIRRERAQVVARGIRLRHLTGADLTREWAHRFYDFYLATIDKRASHDYLTPEFFADVFRTFAHRALLVVAEESGRAVAGALNYFDDRALYGRHWGCLGEYRALHFEVCYYQGLEFAIARGLGRFEAGAQGEHKLQRGFLPTLTLSAHRVFDARLAVGVRRYIEDERRAVDHEIEILNQRTPFRGEGSGDA